jgi:recombinational DNA repair protein (RecF pathway)
MSEDNFKKCLNCNSTQDEVPLMVWYYKERELWLCANCLPLMIHKREQLNLDPQAKKTDKVWDI